MDFFERAVEFRGPSPPKRAYGRLDFTEPQNFEEADEVVVAFESVDIDWASEWSEFFSGIEPARTRRSFDIYWSKLFSAREQILQKDDPLRAPPLFLIEITLRGADRALLQQWELEGASQWHFLEQSDDGVEADVFGNQFVEPQQARYSIKILSEVGSRSLNCAFSMELWPDSSEREIIAAIIGASGNVRSEFLAVYDVGQGSANALLTARGWPWLYYDLGAGVYRNKHTTPASLQFCHTHRAPIVLSHWDADHWAGASVDPAALKHTWIVPRQHLGPIHSAFATRILRAGGQILVWPSSMPSIRIQLAKQDVTISRCTGTDRNGSGLAMIVTDEGADGAWMLTGDAAYNLVNQVLPKKIIALVAPHHGATMGKQSIPPLRHAKSYARVLYSYGPGNAHGRTSISHPTANGVASHSSQNWDHGSWNGALVPGNSVAGADALATARHRSVHLGGALVSWRVPPRPIIPPCATLPAVLGKFCAPLTQS